MSNQLLDFLLHSYFRHFFEVDEFKWDSLVLSLEEEPVFVYYHTSRRFCVRASDLSSDLLELLRTKGRWGPSENRLWENLIENALIVPGNRSLI